MFESLAVGIRTRYFLAFLLSSCVLVLLMFLIFRLTFDRELFRYIQQVEQERLNRLAVHLEQAYVQHQDWDFFRQQPHEAFMAIYREARNEYMSLREKREGMDYASGRHQLAGDQHADNKPDRSRFEERLILLDGEQRLLFGDPRQTPESLAFITLKAQGQEIGRLGLAPISIITDGMIHLFAERQHHALALLALGMIVGVALLSLLLAHFLVRRITGLTGAVAQLAAGRYATCVPVRSRDELGRLAADINTLAQTLARNQQERHRWVADISHELRTPLSVLQAEIEAVQDNIRQPTPQTLASLHSNVLHLGRLVDDLYQLANADIGALSYRKEQLDLHDLAGQAVDFFQNQFRDRNMRLQFLTTHKPLWIFGDGQRLRQLLDNLLTNTLRYTNAGGEACLRLERAPGTICLSMEDSAPGVPLEALPHLFERLYRVESSRNRNSGGTGLGLALCESIVTAHGGAISAHASDLGGLRIEILLPERG